MRALPSRVPSPPVPSVLDEPTSSLTERESARLFAVIRDLKKDGISVIYITHRLEDLRSIGDRVTVLRDGATVYTGALAELTRDVAAGASLSYADVALAPDDPALRARREMEVAFGRATSA